MGIISLSSIFIGIGGNFFSLKIEADEAVSAPGSTQKYLLGDGVNMEV
jgi:hypothetical protein